MRLRASFERAQQSKPSLKRLRQGNSLVLNVSDTSCANDESTNSKFGVTGMISASMSE
jgi:hypothetical protein